KREALRDAWFLFDGVLVFLMWSETWLLSICLALFAPDASSSGFRLMRLLRFTRLARMARLLRSIPELLIIVRAIAIALRSVFFLMVLLVGLVYVFALLFMELLDGKNQAPGSLAYDSFRSLPQSMNTLLLAGALPDQSSLVEDAGATHFLLYPLMLLYMLLASLTVMNMLVGILCEVVTVVSAVEKEEILLKSVKSLLKQLLLDAQADEDGDGSISRREFDKMLTNPTCVRTLSEVGVDVFALVDLADFIFGQKESLSFASFMDAPQGNNEKDAAIATVDVVGTNAIKTVVRSILTAEAAINADDFSGRPQCRLAVTPRRSPEVIEEAGDRRGLELRIRCTTDLPPPAEGEIRVARGTNVGKLAGSVARRLRERNVALVRGAGAVALKHQLRAIAVANNWSWGQVTWRSETSCKPSWWPCSA
ncbi:unnamed protein product, partial [Durusdinium trenchii]